MAVISPGLERQLVQNTAADKIEEPWRQTCCQRDPRKWHFQINREQTSIEQTLNLKTNKKCQKFSQSLGTTVHLNEKKDTINNKRTYEVLSRDMLQDDFKI